jgi:uncharacterized protein YndB with AHSA1/START domain
MTATDTREIEIELEIDAPAAAVWKALTDPEELTRWFPLQAEVTPGEGGSIRLRWTEELDGRNAIRAWEPKRHLRIGWFEPDEEKAGDERRVFYSDTEGRRRLAVDFFLEGKGGHTVLRVVHSGFSNAAGWDEEFEAHRRGWTFELQSLRNYLERHEAEERQVTWVRKPIDVSQDEAWSRLAARVSVSGAADFENLEPGDRYAITTSHGDRLEGEVLLAQAPTEFAGTVENLGHALMRFGIETCTRTGRPEASFWLSTWGDPERADAFRARWNQTFAELFA